MDELLKVLLARAMQNDNGEQGLQDKRDQLAVAQQLGPAGMKQLNGLGTLDERGGLAQQQNAGQLGMLQGQLEQAQQFAKPIGRDYGSVGGNIGGGIGDVLRQLGGGIKAHQLQDQQAQLLGQGGATQTGILDQKDAGRLAARTAQMEALKQALASRIPQQGQAPGMGQAPMMGPGAGDAAPGQMGPLTDTPGWGDAPWDSAMARRPAARHQGNSLGLPPPSFFGL